MKKTYQEDTIKWVQELSHFHCLFLGFRRTSSMVKSKWPSTSRTVRFTSNRLLPSRPLRELSKRSSN